MITYQDLVDVGENTQNRIEFVKKAIRDHKTSEMYRIAFDAEQYDQQKNVTILTRRRMLYTATGKAVPDLYSPNNQICSNFFNRFTVQENQYLLGNGVTLEDENNKVKLGRNFDQQLQSMGRNALVEGISFGFWNFDHLEVFRLTEFVPLWDEETGALRAGVRFYQIDADKPLMATLFEEDGYTDYIMKKGTEMVVLNDKRNYKQVVGTSEADGEEILDGQNYPGFPVIPMWGNLHHESELVGLRNSIDAYDMILSDAVNDLDGNLVYWVLKNSGGMDDVDVAKFMNRLRTVGVAMPEDEGDIQVRDVPIPHEARETYLQRLEQQMYYDYQALNITNLSNGTKTATEINAAYQPFDNKVDQFEYCVLQFLDGLFKIIGIEDNPTFTRNKVANQSDNMQTLLMAAEYLDDEYLTRKATAILGDPDAAQEIIDSRAGMDLDRLMGGDTDGEESSEDIAE